MTKTLGLAILIALTLDEGPCRGAAPAFEVASITPCKPGTPEPPGEHMGLVQFVYPGGRFTANAASLKYLIEWAYGIQPNQHVGGPSWLGTDRYDIAAKAPADATEAEMRLMVQTLLAERFHLVMHKEQREMTALVLSRGKAEPKISLAKDGEAHGMRFAPQNGADQKVASYRIAFTRYSLPQLLYVFSRQMDRVILDKTGLTGEYDFTIELMPDESHPNPVDPSILLDAMRDQLGFSLKSEKTPVDVLAIDSVQKVAAGNE